MIVDPNKDMLYKVLFPIRKQLNEQTPEEKNLGKVNADFFTEAVVCLSKHEFINHERINRIARLLYMMVNQRIVQVAMTDAKEVKKGVHMFIEIRGTGRSRRSFASVMFRQDWYKKVLSDPWNEIGAIIMIASNVCDFYHNVPPSRIMAYAYEAEFYRCLMRNGIKSFKPNRYQKHLMLHFPHGLSDLPDGKLYPITDYQMGTTMCRDKYIWAE